MKNVEPNPEQYRELRRLKFAIDNSREAVYFAREDGRFVYVNQAACQMLGYAEDELLQLSVVDIDPNYPADVWAAHWQRMRREELVELETRHVTADGGERWVEMNIHHYAFESEEFIMGIARDVTLRKQAEVALRESEANYRSLFEQSPVMHASVSPEDYRVVGCNRLLIDGLGCGSKRQLISTPLVDWFEPESRQAVSEALAAARQVDVEQHANLSLRRADGGSISVVVSIAAVLDDTGHARYLAVTAVDVSELRRVNADLRQANSALADFTYIASHDLRAPLRAIDHLASWALEELSDHDNDTAAGRMRQVRQRVQRLETLLEDLLAYSKSGRSDESVGDIDLQLVVDAGAGLLDPTRLLVRTELQERRLRGRKAAIATVLRNLLGNAAKHHDRPPGAAVVSSCVHQADDRYVLVIVADNGPGIEAGMRRKAVQAFQTLRPRDQVEGSGIGLALVKRIVEAEGGHIWLEDNHPRGLRACFTWPRSPRRARTN